MPLYSTLIKVKVLAATTTKGRRVKAICDHKNHTIAYDHGLSDHDNKTAAASALCTKLGGWDYFVYADDAKTDTTIFISCGRHTGFSVFLGGVT